jgi:hypothetical protein
MGTSAETAIVDYHLLIANQGKQTSVFRFHLQQTNGSLPFPFSVCHFHLVSFLCVCGGVGACVSVSIYIYIYLYLYENWKPKRFSLIRLPFAHQRKLSVCKQTKQTYPSLLIGICVLSPPPPRPTPTTHALLTTTQWQHHDIQRIVSESMLQLIKLATNF